MPSRATAARSVNCWVGFILPTSGELVRRLDVLPGEAEVGEQIEARRVELEKAAAAKLAEAHARIAALEAQLAAQGL